MSKTFENGSYSKRSYDISVYEDLLLNSLILPAAVHLYEVVHLSSNSLLITWSPTDAIDFREYKLYRHVSSGLDETTGELIHVSTMITDSSFTDSDIIPNQDYFYRVYVMNNYGKLGGSNIVQTISENVNIIQNGDFEDCDFITGFPENWEFHNYGYPGTSFACNEVPFSGKFSFEASFMDSLPGWNDYILKQIIM